MGRGYFRGFTVYYFFSKYNTTGVFYELEIGSKHAGNFKTKCILNFRKYRSRKKL